MKIVDPSYEILHCRDGEEILAFLERVCRTAYKSEDKIDDGKEVCSHCKGVGNVFVYADEPTPRECPKCQGAKRVQVREPSSHKLIRSILKTDRRKGLYAKVAERLEAEDWKEVAYQDVFEDIAECVVDMVMDGLRDDPPHESVIEHESITVLFTSNRGFTHELVRHRLAAFTQESTRYCNYSKGKFGEKITVTPNREGDVTPKALDAWVFSINTANAEYMRMIRQGVSPQIARDLLPQVLKAEIVITTNLREWRHIFRMRCSPKAHSDMRKLMIPLRDELRQRIPIIFDEV